MNFAEINHCLTTAINTLTRQEIENLQERTVGFTYKADKKLIKELKKRAKLARKARKPKLATAYLEYWESLTLFPEKWKEAQARQFIDEVEKGHRSYD